MSDSSFVSRGGEKLDFALSRFQLNVGDQVCADLGSHVGGFVDCLLRRGAGKVYSVDTSYGTLAWVLRRNPRVVVLERTNAMHVTLPEEVGLVTVDVGWTVQRKILPNAGRLVAPRGHIVTLIKPHYEAQADYLQAGVLPDERLEAVIAHVLERIRADGWTILDQIESPIRGHGGNRELFALLQR